MLNTECIKNIPSYIIEVRFNYSLLMVKIGNHMFTYYSYASYAIHPLVAHFTSAAEEQTTIEAENYSFRPGQGGRCIVGTHTGGHVIEFGVWALIQLAE